MRTISFNMHQDARSIDAVAKLLLDLPRKDDNNLNHMQFDPEGDEFTAVWRYADGTWGVAFRPAGEGTRCKYDNPVYAARAIIDGKHNDHGE